MRKQIYTGLCVAGLLAGCSGSPGAVTQPGATAATAATPPADRKQATARVVVTIPAAGTALRTKYISKGTQSFTLEWDSVPNPGNPQSKTVEVTGPGDYVVTIKTAPDQYTFKASLFDNTLGVGNLLSVGSVTQTLIGDMGNNIALATAGVVKIGDIMLDDHSADCGVPKDFTLTLSAYDSTNYLIDGDYSEPITLNVNDPSTTVSINPVTASNTTITVHYDGSAPQTAAGDVHITAQIGDTLSDQAFTPTCP